MEAQLPKEVQAGLDAARLEAKRASSRLRVSVGDRVFPVLDLRPDGFSVQAEDAPHLRGRVDVHDGANHLFQCLIVAGELEGQQMHYEFKRATAIEARAPLDFERREDAPVALIEDFQG